MNQKQLCHIFIDSNSRFSIRNCPKCKMGGPIAGVVGRSKLTIEEYEKIRLDSAFYTSPFPDETVPMYANLPHTQYGFNQFDAEVIDGWIVYKDKRVIELYKITPYYKGLELYEEEESEEDIGEGWENESCVCEVPSILDTVKKYEYHRYYFYVSHGKFEKTEGTSDIPFLENKILYFDGHPMTDAHVDIEIIEKIYE